MIKVFGRLFQKAAGAGQSPPGAGRSPPGSKGKALGRCPQTAKPLLTKNIRRGLGNPMWGFSKLWSAQNKHGMYRA